jgi:hypothetical protein
VVVWWRELWCSWCCFPASRMRAVSSGCAHLAGCLICKQLWCCQLQLPSPVTELLVCCVPFCLTQFDLIHLLVVLWNCFAPICFVPKLITEQILHLVLLYSVMLLAI